MSTVEAPASHLPLPMQNILSRLAANSTEAEQALVRKAYAYAAAAHAGQVRLSGEPYLSHPLAVAEILAELGFDAHAVTAGLLHDTVEDTKVTLEEVDAEFGEQVADIVDGVTKISMMTFDSKEEQQAENIRKMILAMSHDIRVPIVKLADRVHNMRTLDFQKAHKRQRIAQETMDIYVPLANRLGLHRIKLELEGLSFKYIHPDVYAQISDWLESNQVVERQLIAKIISKLEGILSSNQIEGTVWGRIKHIYSIYKKMTEQNLTLDDMHDILAFRAIVKDVRDCYAVLGLVHAQWKPVPGRFKDYIATPKANLYQSLHTTVVGPDGKPIEIQIRTVEMHEASEYGVAAHWLYKKAGNSQGKMSAEDRSIDSTINWIRKSLDWAVEDDIDDPHEFLNSLRVDLFEHEIFVFTPKGEVMSLRRDSTPLDFAYAVHTEVGNHCVGAKINGAVAPLTHEIKTGDRVEILTNKSSKPSRDWLKIVKTPSAKSKIRRYFAAATKDDDAAAGRDILAKDLRKRGYGISTPRSTRALNAVAEQFNYKQLEDLFAAVGAGKVAPRAVGNKVEQILDPKPEEQLTKTEAIAEVVKQPARGSNRKPQKRGKSASNGIIVKGESNSGLLVRLAHCCNPVTGDDIVGFITRGRGVSVHRANCPNVKGLMEHPERMIEVEWDGAADTLFQVEIVVECLDRMGLLKDVTIAIGDAGGNILSAATSTNREGIATLRFMVEISDASGLDPLLASISSVDSVYDARRLMPGEGGAQLKRRV